MRHMPPSPRRHEVAGIETGRHWPAGALGICSAPRKQCVLAVARTCLPRTVLLCSSFWMWCVLRSKAHAMDNAYRMAERHAHSPRALQWYCVIVSWRYELPGRLPRWTGVSKGTARAALGADVRTVAGRSSPNVELPQSPPPASQPAKKGVFACLPSYQCPLKSFSRGLCVVV